MIEECISEAINRLNAEIQLAMAERPETDSEGQGDDLDHNSEPAIELDKDTQNVQGMPDVFSTICEKIRTCDVYIADISFVGKGAEAQGSKPRRLPNPNVMLELGFAMAISDGKNIITIMDKRTGSRKELPFDLQQRRWPVVIDSKKAETKELAVSELAERLKPFLTPNREITNKEPSLCLDWELGSPNGEGDWGNIRVKSCEIDLFLKNQGTLEAQNAKLTLNESATFAPSSCNRKGGHRDQGSGRVQSGTYEFSLSSQQVLHQKDRIYATTFTHTFRQSLTVDVVIHWEARASGGHFWQGSLTINHQELLSRCETLIRNNRHR